MKTDNRMEKIVALCKRRGFIFQSSEIYGGLNGAWDYGPLGAELKRNLKSDWWRAMTPLRDDIVGMDGAILMSRAVWQASGHEATFTDPMVDCKTCKNRFRADQLTTTPCPQKPSKMVNTCGIAQIGKAFRNEINPRNFTFRSREFEQMEVEFFVRPSEGKVWLEKWLADRLAWYESIGIPRNKITVLDVPEADRAFYSQGTYDLLYEFPFGTEELEGIAYRTDYDLKQHQEASGKPLEYFDEETREKFLPHVVEPSAGVDRTALALLCQAYDEEEVTDDKGAKETRVVLHFHPRMAPIKAGIFPLLKNKPELVEKARAITATLRQHFPVFYDESGAIGRRYRRQDEIGTPFGITIDFETLEGAKDGPLAGQKDTVTLRHRDSMKQERLTISELLPRLQTALA